MTIKTSSLKATTHADGSTKSAYGVYASGTLSVDSSVLFADAPGDSANEEASVGILLNTDALAVLSASTVTGTHSGVQTKAGSKLYVSGGLYTGYSHGGFYFTHGSEGVACINNAYIRDGHYQGIFTNLFASSEVTAGGGFYMGGDTGESSCNMTAYLDGCTIEGSTYAFKLRGSAQERNNTVNMSNCTIVDGYNKPINIENDTHNVNVGCNCNITTSMATLPAQLHFTEEMYRRVYNASKLDGNDYEALLRMMPTQAVAVADAAGDVATASEFNALLAALRNSGYIAQ